MIVASRQLVPLVFAALLLAGASAHAQAPVQAPQQVPHTGVGDAKPLTSADVQGLRTLQAITSRSLEGLTYEQRGDGTIGLDLQGRFMHVLMATPGPDGRPVLSCQTGDHAHAEGVSFESWRPSRNDQLHRLDVSGLIARLPAISRAPVLEEK